MDSPATAQVLKNMLISESQSPEVNKRLFSIIGQQRNTTRFAVLLELLKQNKTIDRSASSNPTFGLGGSTYTEGSVRKEENRNQKVEHSGQFASTFTNFNKRVNGSVPYLGQAQVKKDTKFQKQFSTGVKNTNKIKRSVANSKSTNYLQSKDALISPVSFGGSRQFEFSTEGNKDTNVPIGFKMNPNKGSYPLPLPNRPRTSQNKRQGLSSNKKKIINKKSIVQQQREALSLTPYEMALRVEERHNQERKQGVVKMVSNRSLKKQRAPNQKLGGEVEEVIQRKEKVFKTRDTESDISAIQEKGLRNYYVVEERGGEVDDRLVTPTELKMNQFLSFDTMGESNKTKTGVGSFQYSGALFKTDTAFPALYERKRTLFQGATNNMVTSPREASGKGKGSPPVQRINATSNEDDNLQDMENNLPVWLKERADFRSHFGQKLAFDVFAICSKRPAERLSLEKNYLSKYMKKGYKLFSNLTHTILEKIGDSMTSLTFQDGEILMKEGEEGDGLYILLEGKVEIFVGNTYIQTIENCMVGETAMKEDILRTASIVANNEVRALFLTKSGFANAHSLGGHVDKANKLKFISQLPMFTSWTSNKLEALSMHLPEFERKKGDEIYKQGETTESFYIIHSGKVKIEISLEIKRFNKYPIPNKQWEVMVTNKTVSHTLKNLTEGMFFGHDEIFRNTNRITRATAITDCTLIYINRTRFLEFFSGDDSTFLKQGDFSVDMNKISAQIRKEENYLKTRKNLILDAVKKNAPKEMLSRQVQTSSIDQMKLRKEPWSRQNLTSYRDMKMKKLNPWVNSLAKGEGSKSTKVLKIQRKKYIIDAFDHMNDEISKAGEIIINLITSTISSSTRHSIMSES